jgi:hypothetical protein
MLGARSGHVAFSVFESCARLIAKVAPGAATVVRGPPDRCIWWMLILAGAGGDECSCSPRCSASRMLSKVDGLRQRI